MEQFKSVDDILDFAMEQEDIAADFYIDLAEKVEKPGIDKLFTDLAKEELGHRVKLLKMKEEGIPSLSLDDIEDMKLSDYLADVREPDEELSYQEALLVAIGREKNAVDLYSDLLNKVSGNKLTDILNIIIREEQKHKLRLESEYDKNVLTEN